MCSILLTAYNKVSRTIGRSARLPWRHASPALEGMGERADFSVAEQPGGLRDGQFIVLQIALGEVGIVVGQRRFDPVPGDALVGTVPASALSAATGGPT